MNLMYLTGRRLKVFVRQPAFLLATLIQPVIWLFLFGNLFRRIVELPGFGSGNYLTYLIPGVVVMTAVSSSMWSGMGVLEEIDRGTMNRFLATPARRGAILDAVVIETTLSVTFQAVAIVLLGLAAGAEFTGSGVLLLLAGAALLAVVFSTLSNIAGMLVRQRESIIGLNTLLLLPLTFLSSAFMVPGLMPGWMQAIARGNPVNWALEACRPALAGTPDWPRTLQYGGGLALLAIALLLLSSRTFRSYQKSV
ncbi:ABC transporter permease [Dactylosporangium vinaceum]|uniref:Transport permease protein n=1 Tax=Dactylosporangium vinaceum TaxID=53362 RepID=A0ABV5M8J9_9ACTN|nr:ABC transporter permease [Dactylosporangium vinaceum]UAB94581.1 ABC transporter permease [Dactylosporangium vinaceum]